MRTVIKYFLLLGLIITMKLFFLIVTSGQTPLPQSIPIEVVDYSDSLRALRLSTGGTVEEVFRKGIHAKAALLQIEQIGKPSFLERLNQKDYQVVVEMMQGFRVNREEAVFAEPNPDFFLNLAKLRGGKPDTLFFETYKQTVPGPSVWEVYIEQQTDYSGCTKYGTLELVKLYRQWVNYRWQFPRNYASQVREFIQNIENTFTEGTCACGQKESMLREFTEFVKEFPKATIIPKVNKRIRDIKANKSNFRFECGSG